MQIQRVCLNAIEFAVGSSLWLSLVEVRLGTSFAVELLNFVGVNVEQIAVVRLLIRSSEATENYHVVLRDLEETASLKANPVGIFLDFEVKSLPVVSFLEVKFFDEVGPLTTIEASNHIESFIVESQGRVEVPSSVQVGNLCPSI